MGQPTGQRFIVRDARYRERPTDGRDVMAETQFTDVADACARGLVEFLHHRPLEQQDAFGEEFPMIVVEDEEGNVLSRWGVKRVERWGVVREWGEPEQG